MNSTPNQTVLNMKKLHLLLISPIVLSLIVSCASSRRPNHEPAANAAQPELLGTPVEIDLGTHEGYGYRNGAVIKSKANDIYPNMVSMIDLDGDGSFDSAREQYLPGDGIRTFYNLKAAKGVSHVENTLSERKVLAYFDLGYQVKERARKIAQPNPPPKAVQVNDSKKQRQEFDPVGPASKRKVTQPTPVSKVSNLSTKSRAPKYATQSTSSTKLSPTAKRRYDKWVEAQEAAKADGRPLIDLDEYPGPDAIVEPTSTADN